MRSSSSSGVGVGMVREGMLRSCLQDTGFLEDRNGLDLCSYMVHSLLLGEEEEEEEEECGRKRGLRPGRFERRGTRVGHSPVWQGKATD